MADIDEVQKAIDFADVFAMGFRLFPQRLFMDARWNDKQGPMIRVVEPMRSVEERYFWLGKVRPTFGPPERFTFMPWPHSLRYLRESGILQRIEDRLVSEQSDMAKHCAAAFAKLERLEHRAIVDAINGEDQYSTLWTAAH